MRALPRRGMPFRPNFVQVQGLRPRFVSFGFKKKPDLRTYRPTCLPTCIRTCTHTYMRRWRNSGGYPRDAAHDARTRIVESRHTCPSAVAQAFLAEFAHIVQEGADGYELVGIARVEVEVAEAIRSGTTQRARRSGRDGGAKSAAKRARAGSMRVARLWRLRRPRGFASCASPMGMQSGDQGPSDASLPGGWRGPARLAVGGGAVGCASGLQPACAAVAK